MTDSDRREAEAAMKIEKASRGKCIKLNALRKRNGGSDWGGCFCDKEDRGMFLKSFKNWFKKISKLANQN